MRIILVAVVTLSFSVAASQSLAEEGSSLDVTFSQLSGSTDYQIGGLVQLANGASGYVHFPLSKLDFPSEMSVLGIGLNIRHARNLITARISSSTDASPTTMRDYDWGVPDVNPFTTPSTLDIYSESESDGEMQMLELRYAGISQPKYSDFTGYMGVGLLIQKFHFDVHDGLQEYPSMGFPADPLPGDILIYDVDMYIPYGFVRIEREARDSGWSWYAELAASAWATVEDQDQHLLRGKVNQGNYDGTAIIYDLGVTYQGSSKFMVTLSYRQTNIDTEGEQVSSLDGIYNHTIYAENHSEHSLYSLSLNLPF